ncbi:Uncharacterized protein Rs2_17422 [Raphanus sativus]|nr:Uncharacterized protein Rs2_17422 [Raphanus sativus]
MAQERRPNISLMSYNRVNPSPLVLLIILKRPPKVRVSHDSIPFRFFTKPMESRRSERLDLGVGWVKEASSSFVDGRDASHGDGAESGREDRAQGDRTVEAKLQKVRLVRSHFYQFQQFSGSPKQCISCCFSSVICNNNYPRFTVLLLYSQCGCICCCYRSLPHHVLRSLGRMSR